jgi:uncharacterized protein (DUF1778 family)
MLGELEEKYVAQSIELEYCRDRIDPLETANTQLAILMESLLDTIDARFANIEGDPLQRAAEIAGSMLVGEISLNASESRAEEIIEEENQPKVIEVPEELVIEEAASEEEIEEVATADDLESVATLAKEIGEESAAIDNKPAASGIRDLLERVEALAAKAGVMGCDILPEDAVETDEVDLEVDEPRQAGAAG